MENQKSFVHHEEPRMLPEEMIMMIITYLSEIEDFKNCMLLSKYFRDLMFRSPEIMRKIPYVFNFNVKKEQISQFLSKRGKYIKKLKIKNTDYLKIYFTTNDISLIPFILKSTINLEDYICEIPTFGTWNVNYDYNAIDPFNLPKLKRLSICGPTIHFIKNAQNVQNLKTFTFYDDIDETIAKFLCSQNNLKTLIIKRNVSNMNFSKIIFEAKFSLTKFEFRQKNNSSNLSFDKFFENQSKSLKEITVDGRLSLEQFNYIKRCENLQNLSSRSCFKNHNFDWSLNNLRDLNCKSLKLNLVYTIFPNLVTLKCQKFEDAEGTFDKLQKLGVNELNCNAIKNCKFPNLKMLVVNSITDDNYWNQLAENITTLEVFKFIKPTNFSQFLIILKSVKYFKNIKYFEVIDEVTKTRVLICGFNKITKISNIYSEQRQEILDILKENLINFKIKFVNI